jgi:predicted dehydrogenase
VISRPDVQIVIVSTWPNSHAEVAVAGARNGKHILCEKPLGRNPKEAREIVEAAQAHRVKLKTGFNLRHKAGIAKAREAYDQGAVGQLMYIRCCLGHGGRLAYEKEWRADQEIAGGGHLVDHGIHGIDLLRWFMGDFIEVSAFNATLFWEMKPLEDNAFVLFRDGYGLIASLHSSCTQWKNLFSLEIFGQLGYILVNGLGGSYGGETVTIGRRRSDSGPPDEELFAFSKPDYSLYNEWAEFVAAIQEDREPLGNGYDGYQALMLAYSAYASARKNHVVESGKF